MGGLRVAMLSYRSKPHVGGQGVYVAHLSRELAALGHDVTVFSGQPYPQLDPRVRLAPLPSLDLYRDTDPFRVPKLREFRDATDVLEFATMCVGAFPEPRTFSRRAARALRARRGDFDVVHDNQCLGDGLLPIARMHPLVTTIHHPITRDRATDLAGAPGWRRRFAVRRWYSFLSMQKRVARAQRRVLTVSDSSKRDIVTDFGVDPAAVHVVPLGVQTDVFRPDLAPTVPGRIVAMASADSPLKGIDVLLRAMPRVRASRGGAPLELVLVTRPDAGGLTRRLVRELGLGDVVRFVDSLTSAEVAALFASAQVMCVPSRYEGFSLPTVEAMACGTPLVVSRAGALPEVVGEPGAAADLVPPDDPASLAAALAALLGDPDRCERMGVAGRERAVSTYDWSAVARATARHYEAAITEHHAAPAVPPSPAPPPGDAPAPTTTTDEGPLTHAHR